MRFHRQFSLQLPASQDFEPIEQRPDQTLFLHHGGVNGSAIVELVELFHVDDRIARGECNIIEAAFWDPPNQRHLSTFKTRPNPTAGSGGLAFPSAGAGFAVPTGFSGAKTFDAMLRSGAICQVM